MDTAPVRLVTNTPDAERAAQIRANVIKALEPVLAELDDAKKDGFTVQFTLGADALGRNVIQALRLSKEF